MNMFPCNREEWLATGQEREKKENAIDFVKWIDKNGHISVTWGGNGIIHDIDKLYEMYLESLKDSK